MEPYLGIYDPKGNMRSILGEHTNLSVRPDFEEQLKISIFEVLPLTKRDQPLTLLCLSKSTLHIKEIQSLGTIPVLTPILKYFHVCLAYHMQLIRCDLEMIQNPHFKIIKEKSIIHPREYTLMKRK